MFQSIAFYTVGNGAGYIAIGDFNGDGKRDLANTNYNSNSVSMLIGNGDGTFKPACFL